MCGLVGIIDRNSSSLETDIIIMRDTVSYRGPDGFGHVLFTEDGIALGHRRLSILDLTDAGRQPMSDESGSLIIVYNGEVYNFLELRKELEKYGYVFKSGTDTEVINGKLRVWNDLTACLPLLFGTGKKRKYSYQETGWG